MPLSLFHHGDLAHYQGVTGEAGEFDHGFGGDVAASGFRFVNADPPFHLMYCLDASDPAVPVQLPEINYLPLLYGFHYAAFDGTFIYRLLNAMEIEIIRPTELQYSDDFPYLGHPPEFPEAPVSLHRIPYDPTVAEDALSLQGVFDLSGLQGAERERAIEIALSPNSYVDDPDNPPYPDWTRENMMVCLGRGPFGQDSPSKSCSNPDCTADIKFRIDEETVIRVDTMRTIAIHQPDPNDELIWGSAFVQIIFEFCDCCHSIRASNQCT